MNKKTAATLVRSSAAEYLTFVAASGQGGVEVVDKNYLTDDEFAHRTRQPIGFLT